MVAMCCTIIWMFGKREVSSSTRPTCIAQIQMRTLILKQFINDYEVFCSNSRVHAVQSLPDVKESLYAARYGGIDVDDLEANIRMLT